MLWIQRSTKEGRNSVAIIVSEERCVIVTVTKRRGGVVLKFDGPPEIRIIRKEMIDGAIQLEAGGVIPPGTYTRSQLERAVARKLEPSPAGEDV